MKYLLLLILPLPLFAKLNGSGDFQLWNTDSIHVHLGKQALFSGETEFRYGRDSSKLFYKHYQGGVTYVYSRNMVITPFYRQIYHRREDKWRKNHVPALDLKFQMQIQTRWVISNRNRVEYHIRKEGNLWRYRNCLEFLTPFRITGRGIGPYFSNEIFWTESRGLSENRLICGAKIPYHQRTQLSLYYLLRSRKNQNTDWLQQNILGIHFSLHF